MALGETGRQRFATHPHQHPDAFLSDWVDIQKYAGSCPTKTITHYLNLPALKQALKHAALGKQVGVDNFPVELLQTLPEPLLDQFLVALLTSLLGPDYESTSDSFSPDLSQWPPSFKIIVISLLQKGKENPVLINKKRPIGLAPRVRLLPEVCVNNALREVADKWVGETQFAFKPAVSCTFATMIIDTVIMLSYARKGRLIVLYIDFADAYTTIPLEPLFVFLTLLGVHKSIVDFLRQLMQVYLQYKSWYGLSAFFRQLKGVIQGSITGCLIFNIFIEILCKHLEKHIKGFNFGAPSDSVMYVLRIIYADDCTLLLTSVEELREALRILAMWEEATGMQVKFKEKLKTVAAAIFWRGGRPYTPKIKATYHPPQGPPVNVPFLTHKESHKVLGSLHSLDSNLEEHQERLKETTKKQFGAMHAAQVPDASTKTVTDAVVRGTAQFHCLRPASMQIYDLIEVVRRQYCRMKLREVVSSPRLLFYDAHARGMTHMWVAAQAALLRIVMVFLNLPRTSTVYMVCISNLIHTLLMAGILLSPFHDELPPLHLFYPSLSKTIMGAWMLAMDAAKWCVRGALPMIEMEGYIKSHFPSGHTPLWTHPTVISAGLHQPMLIEAGILHLSDIMTQYQSLIDCDQFRLRNPHSPIPRDQYDRLLAHVRSNQLVCPRYRHPDTSFTAVRPYNMNPRSFLLFPVESSRRAGGSTRTFWIGRLPAGAPEAGPIAMEWYEQNRWDTTTQRDWAKHFMDQGTTWVEDDLHLRAFEVTMSYQHRSNSYYLTYNNANLYKGKLRTWFSNTVTQHAPRPDHMCPAQTTPLGHLRISSMESLRQEYPFPLPWQEAATSLSHRYDAPADYEEVEALQPDDPAYVDPLLLTAPHAVVDMPGLRITTEDEVHPGRTNYVATMLQSVCDKKRVEVIFATDGSRLYSTEERAVVSGMAIFKGTNTTPILFKLIGAWTSYSSEIAAVLKAIEEATPLGQVILILTDCLSAVLSIVFFPQGHYSKMVNRAWYFLIAEVCAAIIRLRAKGGDVIWFKVKSHVGEFRNATADTLAKMAALYYPGTQPREGEQQAPDHIMHNLSANDIRLTASQAVYTDADYNFIDRKLQSAATHALNDYLCDWLRLFTNQRWAQAVQNSQWLQILLNRKKDQGALAHFIELWRTDRVCLPSHRWVDSDEPCPLGCKVGGDGENCKCDLSHFVFDCPHNSEARARWLANISTLPSFTYKLALIARLRGDTTEQAFQGEQDMEDSHLCCIMSGVLELRGDEGLLLQAKDISDDTKAKTVSTILSIMKSARKQWVDFRKLMQDARDLRREEEEAANARERQATYFPPRGV